MSAVADACDCDIAIIGAGMAGASLAAALAPHAAVTMLEMEAQPGYHATGRSAAFWTESYGGPGVLPLTAASGPYLRDHGFLKQRGALTLARQPDEVRLRAWAAEFSELGVRMELLAGAALLRHIPQLRPAWTLGAWEPDCSDIDVAGLHQHYLAAAKAAGAGLLCKAEVAAGGHGPAGWAITLADGRTLTVRLLVNAAGAWADALAQRCGVRPVGITPLRRTVVQARVVPDPAPDLPLVLDVNEQFYFKPEAGRLWISPHDEVPSPPCDAAPEELDVAVTIDRFEQVVDWPIAALEQRWAGLRSFAPDRLPVYGIAPDSPAFFWCAGQGGFGIQTAPAAADLAARLVLGQAPGAVDPLPYDPRRFF